MRGWVPPYSWPRCRQSPGTRNGRTARLSRDRHRGAKGVIPSRGLASVPCRRPLKVGCHPNRAELALELRGLADETWGDLKELRAKTVQNQRSRFLAREALERWKVISRDDPHSPTGGRCLRRGSAGNAGCYRGVDGLRYGSGRQTGIDRCANLGRVSMHARGQVKEREESSVDTNCGCECLLRVPLQTQIHHISGMRICLPAVLRGAVVRFKVSVISALLFLVMLLFSGVVTSSLVVAGQRHSSDLLRLEQLALGVLGDGHGVDVSVIVAACRMEFIETRHCPLAAI